MSPRTRSATTASTAQIASDNCHGRTMTPKIASAAITHVMRCDMSIPVGTGPDDSVRVVISAGLLLYRRRSSSAEVLLVHPGGPYWKKKDDGAWSVPKGILEPQEDELTGARREFREETGFAVDARA